MDVPPDNFVERTLPGKPEGFSRSDTKTVPRKGINLEQTLPAGSFFPPSPQGDGSTEGRFMGRGMVNGGQGLQ